MRFVLVDPWKIERIPSAMASLNLCGTFASPLRAAWTWHRCTFALGNFSLKTFSGRAAHPCLLGFG